MFFVILFFLQTTSKITPMPYYTPGFWPSAKYTPGAYLRNSTVDETDSRKLVLIFSDQLETLIMSIGIAISQPSENQLSHCA